MVENLLFLDNEHTEIGEFDSLPSEKIYYVVMTKYKILCCIYLVKMGIKILVTQTDGV